MKQKIIKFTPEELTWALQNKLTQYGLPLDIELVAIKYDAFKQQVSAVIRSDLFKDTIDDTQTLEVSSTNPLPTTVQQLPSQQQEDVVKEVSQKNSTTIVVQAPFVTSIGAGIKTLGVKPETNMGTCGFEDEFSREQRRVLKFLSVGDCVCVRPRQFLKTEWGDINDTVRSLGGRWVKGVIDQWVIPKGVRCVEGV